MENYKISETTHIANLVSGYRNDNLSEAELQELQYWLNDSVANKMLFEELINSEHQKDALSLMLKYKKKAETLEQIFALPKTSKPTIKNLMTSALFRYAAAIIVLLSIAMYGYYYQPFNKSLNSEMHNVTDVSPGGNRAILTLSDGRNIDLNEQKNGVMIDVKGLKYSDGTAVSGLEPENMVNSTSTIATPKGGQYQVILPDGTKVWLNAASSIKFETTFKMSSVRKVELNGEAYFEVAKQVQMKIINGKSRKVPIPFIVKTIMQDTEVLGTHFNINSYEDEKSTETTLIEGAVRVVSTHPGSEGTNGKGLNEVLKPGQQSELDINGFKIKEVDLNEAVAWKNNYFIFNDEELKSIMRKLSRWYNIDVSYEGSYRPQYFTGSVSASKNLSEALKILELTGNITYRIDKPKEGKQERRVVIMM